MLSRFADLRAVKPSELFLLVAEYNDLFWYFDERNVYFSSNYKNFVAFEKLLAAGADAFEAANDASIMVDRRFTCAYSVLKRSAVNQYHLFFGDGTTISLGSIKMAKLVQDLRSDGEVVVAADPVSEVLLLS